jgi:hypothetical protein
MERETVPSACLRRKQTISFKKKNVDENVALRCTWFSIWDAL